MFGIFRQQGRICSSRSPRNYVPYCLLGFWQHLRTDPPPIILSESADPNAKTDWTCSDAALHLFLAPLSPTYRCSNVHRAVPVGWGVACRAVDERTGLSVGGGVCGWGGVRERVVRVWGGGGFCWRWAGCYVGCVGWVGGVGGASSVMQSRYYAHVNVMGVHSKVSHFLLRWAFAQGLLLGSLLYDAKHATG